MKKNIGKIIFSLMICFTFSLIIAATSLAATTVAVIGEKTYTSLSSAIKEVEDGQTIVLQKNISYSKNVGVNSTGKSFILDLNNKTIKFKGTSYLNIKNGTITIKNGTIKNSAGNTVMSVKKNANVKISSGTYEGIIKNAGKLTINKGTFKTEIINTNTLLIKNGSFTEIKSNYDVSSVKDGILVNKGGVITIKGGEFSSTSRCNLIENYSNSTMKISGGRFTNSSAYSTSGTVIYNEGKVTFSNGTLSGENYCQYVVLNEGGSFIMKGGTINQNAPYGHCAVITVGGTIKMSSGSIIGTNHYDAIVGQKDYNIKITGGNLSVNNTQAILLYGTSSYSIGSNVTISVTGNPQGVYIINE
ncbi:MAG: autotransporter adhesin family protein [Lachnospiraceae bacterium]|nr:autotransporter adhesin family protein [Lachnospiraceae bacterium]